MRIVWLPSARTQREAAIDYIAEDNPQAALQQLDEITKQIGHLAKHPRMGKPGPDGDTRQLVIARTPFVAVYDLRDSMVRILRIYHHAQKRP